MSKPSNGGYRYWPRQSPFALGEEAHRRRRLRSIRHQIAQGTASTAEVAALLSLPVELGFELLTDAETLIHNAKQLRSGPRKATGPDGVAPQDLGNIEIAEIMRAVSPRLRSGEYRSPPPKPVDIPKGPNEVRTIKIPSLIDNVISKTISAPLAEIVDCVFYDESYGFRRGRSPQHMLAAVVAEMEVTGRSILINDDVRRAFDHVRIVQVAEILRSLGMDQRTIDLIVQLVTAGQISVIRNCLPSIAELIGLNQGNSLSPVLMNLLLHTVLDAPFRESLPEARLHRYADNLAIVCRDRLSADRYRDLATQLLSAAGLELKGEGGGIFDLRSEPTDLLGFRLAWQQDRVSVTLTEPARAHVAVMLEELWREYEEPELLVCDCILGWIASLGPVYGSVDREALYDAVSQIAAGFGVRDLVSPERLLEQWSKAHEGWVDRLSNARERVNACS